MLTPSSWKTLSWKIKFPLNALVFGLTAFFYLSFTGPYRLIAERLAGADGSYSATFAFVLTALLFWLPAALVVELLTAGGYLRESAEPSRLDDLADWMGRRRWRLLGAALALVLLALGAGIVLFERLPEERLAVRLEVLEAGAAPPGEWLEFRGRLLLERTVKTGGERPLVYVPCVSPDWQEGQPVAVFLALDELQAALLRLDQAEKRRPPVPPWLEAPVAPKPPPAPEGRELHGMTQKALPPEVAAAFRRQGIQPTPRAFLFRENVEPRSLASFAWGLITAGLVLGLLTAGVWAFLARRERGPSLTGVNLLGPPAPGWQRLPPTRPDGLTTDPHDDGLSPNPP